MWTKDDHARYEDRVAKDFEALEKAVNTLTTRITLMLGGLGLIAFVLPIISPWLRSLLDVPALPP